MPLSEREQKILHELEQALFKEDPTFVSRVQSETVYKHAGRNLKWAAVIFLAGFGVLLGTFTFSVPLAFVGFMLMLLSAISFEANLRRMGRAGIHDITHSIHSSNRSATIKHLQDRMRDRFKRDQS